MNKRMLDTGTLRVESFATSRVKGNAAGTVHGHAWTVYDATCPSPSCAVVCRTRYDTPCVVEQA
ncbi:hypothetical protein [Longimicrobium sp.]|uniref:hypothetical protein n=1 Tax=Longimicrobium sp. TaxID=2029185 RepID=UPI003B3B772D